MRRKARTAILAESDSPLLGELAGEIERSHRVEMIRSPAKSLVMGKARDSVAHEPFYLGEILVTTCTVEIGGHRGFGAILGDRGDAAYQLAVVDAAYRAGLPETAAWSAKLLAEERRVRQRHAREEALVRTTSVQFDTKR